MPTDSPALTQHPPIVSLHICIAVLVVIEMLGSEEFGSHDQRLSTFPASYFWLPNFGVSDSHDRTLDIRHPDSMIVVRPV